MFIEISDLDQELSLISNTNNHYELFYVISLQSFNFIIICYIPTCYERILFVKIFSHTD